MTPEEKILAALTLRAMSRHELAKIIGFDGLRTMGFLRRLKEAGEIRVTANESYERNPMRKEVGND